MLINYEYTRRVLSDVYVQVTNNVYQIESTLDTPDDQLAQMDELRRRMGVVYPMG